jgi:hypothetical protein
LEILIEKNPNEKTDGYLNFQQRARRIISGQSVISVLQTREPLAKLARGGFQNRWLARALADFFLARTQARGSFIWTSFIVESYYILPTFFILSF